MMLTQNTLSKLAFVFLVFDVSNRATFDKVIEEFIENYNEKNTVDTRVLYLLGNKTDKSPRQVTEEEAQTYAKNYGLLYFETSAKTGQNIEETFRFAIEKVCSNIDQKKYQPEDKYDRFGITKTK